MKMIMPETQDLVFTKWDRLTRGLFPFKVNQYLMGMTFSEVEEFQIWLRNGLDTGKLVFEDGIITKSENNTAT